MNEQVALMGAKGPPKIITVGGRTYQFAPAITYSVMANISAAALEADKTALRAVKDIVDPDDYRGAVRELMLAYQVGEYRVDGGARAQKYLETVEGAVTLLKLLSLDGATEEELFELLTKHRKAFDEVMEEIQEASLPDTPSGAPSPKAKAPRNKRRGR